MRNYLFATAAVAAMIGSAPAMANPGAALFADYLLTSTSAAGALGVGTGGAGGAGGKGGNSGPLTNSPTTTQNDKTKVDGSVGVGLGQAPGSIVGCIGEQRWLWGAAQYPVTVDGGCAQLLADSAIRSGDPAARTQGLAIMNKFAVRYFGDDTKPSVGGDATFRQ